jgi:hypothetical protein
MYSGNEIKSQSLSSIPIPIAYNFKLFRLLITFTFTIFSKNLF